MKIYQPKDYKGNKLVSDKELAAKNYVTQEQHATKADKEAFEAHKNNEVIHVTQDNKDRWNDTYTTSETDAALDLKADKTTVAEELAKKPDITVVGEKGTSLLFNEADGGGAVFEGDNFKSGVAVNDGSRNIYAQLYAKNTDGSQAKRLNVSLTGIYYTKDKENASEFDSNDELIVKSDLADFETHIADDVIHVTQQDKDLWNDHVSTADFNAHKDDKEIHITGTERDTWNKKVTTEQLEATKKSLQDEISEKVASMLHWKGSVATEDLLPQDGNITGDCYNVTATGANWAWTGTEWDKLSEDISGLATKDELRSAQENLTNEIAKKVNTTDYDNKVAELKADIDTRALQTTVDGIETRTQALETKTTELETNKADKTELGNTNQALDDYKEEAKQAFDSYKEEVKQQLETKVDNTTYEQEKQDLQVDIDEKVKTLQEDIDTRATEADLTTAEGRIDTLESTTENLSKTKADQTSLEEAKQEFETYKQEKQEEFEQYQQEVETQLGTKVDNDEYTQKVDELQGEIDAKVEQTDYNEKVKSIEDILKTKADEDSVQSRLDEKVNIEDYNQKVSDFQTELNTKETKETVKKVTDRVSSLETVTQSLSNTKANKTYLDEKISELTESLNSYKEETDTALDTKVNESAYNSKVTELQGKIDTKVDNTIYTSKVSSLEDEIATKADQTTVTQELAKKVDNETFNTQINTKANKTEVENKLKLKADVTELNNLKGEVTTIDGRVQALEAVEVDQSYNQDSQNAQSGTAVREAIAPLATQAALLSHEAKAQATYAVKTEVQKSLDTLTQKAQELDTNKEDKTTVTTLKGRVDKIEGEYITQDSTFQYTPTVSTAWGNSRNASCNYFQVHARYIRPGKLKSVTIQGKDDTYATSTPYLTLFTSTTGESWTKLATSTNSTAVTNAEPGTFEFDNLTLPSDLHIRFVFTNTNDNISPEGDNTLVGVSGMQRASDDLISKVFGASISADYLIRFTFNYDASTTESVKNHIGDSSKHFTGNEKPWLISFLQGYDGTTSVKNILDRLGETATESTVAEIQDKLSKKAEQSTVTALSQTVSTKADKTALDALTTTVNTKASEESVNKLQTELQSAKDDVTQAQTDITELETRVTSAESTITSLESTKATKDELEQEVSQLESSITETTEKITTHTEDGDIHVTADQKKGWDDKYTKQEVTDLLTSKADQSTVTEALELKADKSKLEELKTEVGTKASTETVTALQDQVTGIDTEVDGLTSNLESLTTKVDGIDEIVKTKADQTALTTLENTVSSNKTEIEGKLTTAKTELEEKIKDAVSSMFKWKGEVENEEALKAIEEKVVGDVYNVKEDGANYVWSGEEWDKLSENITGLATRDELTTAKGELQGNIDKVSGELTTTKTELSGKITELESTVSANKTEIDGKLDTHEKNTTVHFTGEEKKNLTAQVNTLETTVASKVNSTDFESFKSEVGTTYATKTEVTELSATIDKKAAQADLDELSDQVEANKTALTSKVENTDFEELKTKVESNTTALGTKADSATVTDLTAKVEKKLDKDEFNTTIADYAKTETVTELTDRVDSLESQVTELDTEVKTKASQTELTNLTSTVATNKSDIEGKLKSAQEQLEEKINNAVSSMFRWKGDIATKAELDELEDHEVGDVYNVEEDGANYVWSGEEWDKLSENITGLATQEQLTTAQNTLQGSIDKVSGDLTSAKQELEGKISGVETKATKNETEITSLKSSVTDLTGKLTTAEGEIDELQSNIETKAELETVTALEGKVTQLEKSVESLEAGTITVDQKFTSDSEKPQSGKAIAEELQKYATTEKLEEKANTSDLDTAKTDLQSKINKNSTDIETANNNITTLQGQVTTLEESVETVETSVTELQSTIQEKASQIEVTQLSATVTSNKTELEGNISKAKEELKQEITKAVSSMFKWKGTKQTYEELESLEEHEIGDVWNVENTGANYVWTNDGEEGGKWDKLSENIEGLVSNEDLTKAKQELESKITELTGKVATNESGITSLNSSVSTLQTSVSAAEGEIDTLQSQITTKAETEKVTEVETKVTALEKSVEDLKSSQITVDKTFSGESENPQSGTAIAEELKKYTTTEKLNELQTTVESKIDEDTLTEKLTDYVTTTNLTTELEKKAEKETVEALQSTVSGLQTSLSEKADSSALSELEKKVTANTTALNDKVSNSELETLQSQVDENTAALEDLASSEALTALTAKVDANTAALKTKAETTTVSQLETKVNGKLDTTTFNQEIAKYTLKDTFDELSETVGNKADQSALEELKSTVETNETDIESKLSTHEQNEEIHFTDNEKKELTDKVETLETNIGEKANTSDLNSFKSMVSSTYATKSEVTTLTSTVNSKASQTDLENLQTQVEANEAAIENKVDNEDFTALQTQVTTNTSTLESKADSVTVETLSGKVDKKLDTATFDSTIATYAKTETLNELSSTVEANKTTAETALSNHVKDATLHVTAAEHEKIAKIITCDEATKIAIYTDPAKAPALEDREPGILYLIGGNSGSSVSNLSKQLILTVKKNSGFNTISLGNVLGTWSGEDHGVITAGSLDWGDNSDIVLLTDDMGVDNPLLTHEYTDELEEHKITIRGKIKWNGNDYLTTENNRLGNYLTKIEIPDGCISGIYDFTDNMFSEYKYLESVPSGLFDNCPDATSFNTTFYGCTALTSIPSDIFRKNTKVTEFNGCFEESGLTSIPEDLFATCTNCNNFSYTFTSCQNLETIPEHLFDNCPYETTFCNTFNGCTSVTSHLPELWYTKAYNRGIVFDGCDKAPNYNDACTVGYALVNDPPKAGVMELHIETTSDYQTVNIGQYIGNFSDNLNVITHGYGGGSFDWGDQYDSEADGPVEFYQRASVDDPKYEHVYSTPGEYIITIRGLITWGPKDYETLSNINTEAYKKAVIHVLKSITIPENEISPIYDLNTHAFQSGDSHLTEIPEGLFDNLLLLNDFSYCFAWCTSLKSIPDNLFKKCRKAENFEGTFYQSGLRSIPLHLFDNCFEVKNLGACFAYCNITSPLPELWNTYPDANHHAYYFECFDNCWLAPNYQDAVDTNWASEYSAGKLELHIETNSNGYTLDLGPRLYDKGSDTSVEEQINYGFINWGDNTDKVVFLWDDLPTDSKFQHTYEAQGKYTITIEGSIKWCQGNTNNETDISKVLTSITIPEDGYGGCINDITPYAFANCTKLTSIPADLISGLSVKDLSNCFSNTAFTHIPSRLFEGSSVTNLSRCFYGCKNMTNIGSDEDNFFSYCSSVENLSECFAECTSLKTVASDITSYCKNVTNFTKCFYNCSNFASEEWSQELPHLWEVYGDKVTQHTDCFTGCTQATNYDDAVNAGWASSGGGDNDSIVYEFLIHEDTDIPEEKIEYLGANKDFTPSYMDYEQDKFIDGSWKDTWVYNFCRPCLLSFDKQTVIYLDPNDMSKTIGGQPSNHTDESQDFNVMVEVDQVWIKEEDDENGNHHIYLSNKKVNDSYDCYSHTDDNGVVKDHLYISKYNGYLDSSEKIRSLGNKDTATSISFGTKLLSRCEANGPGWNCWSWSQIRLFRYMLLLVGKSTNCQKVFGNGYKNEVGNNPQSIISGNNDIKGQFYGKNTFDSSVTVFFIDDFWGNNNILINGFITGDDGHLYIRMTGPYPYITNGDPMWRQDNKELYTDIGLFGENETRNYHGYIEKMKLIPQVGLIPLHTSNVYDNTLTGSISTGYCSCYQIYYRDSYRLWIGYLPATNEDTGGALNFATSKTSSPDSFIQAAGVALSCL